MELLINLLERKNLCFKSFYTICGDFLDEIAKGDSTNLERFQARRQGLLNVLEQLEFEITHYLASFDAEPGLLDALMTGEVRTKVNMLFREKDALVKEILDLDLQILQHIDRIKNDTIQKLQSVQTGRRTLGAYRSPIEKVESAEGAKIVDHKA